MNSYKSIIVIFIINLMPVFTTPSFAIVDVSNVDIKKGEAVKDIGQAVQNHTPGCKLVIKNINFTLYSDRSIGGIRIATVTPGEYLTVDYLPGWYKVKAKGWIGWMPDPRSGLKKAALKKINCPDKNE